MHMIPESVHTSCDLGASMELAVMQGPGQERHEIMKRRRSRPRS